MQSEEARDMAWQRTYTHCLYYLAQVLSLTQSLQLGVHGNLTVLQNAIAVIGWEPLANWFISLGCNFSQLWTPNVPKQTN